LEQRNKLIEDLEKTMSQAKGRASDAEKVQKLQFDNQILMGRLTQYKKAEKGVKEIVADYEMMK
jgi:hypothetical protein